MCEIKRGFNVSEIVSKTLFYKNHRIHLKAEKILVRISQKFNWINQKLISTVSTAKLPSSLICVLTFVQLIQHYYNRMLMSFLPEWNDILYQLLTIQYLKTIFPFKKPENCIYLPPTRDTWKASEEVWSFSHNLQYFIEHHFNLLI